MKHRPPDVPGIKLCAEAGTPYTQSMKRPRILIPLPAYDDTTPKKYGIKQSYAHAIARSEGEPLCIVRPDEDRLLELLSVADGILIIGGYDIDSKYYREKNTGHTKHIDHERDRVELLLVHLAMKHQIPLLGICRGMQVMNVALGGSLYQDVQGELPGAIDHDNHKDKRSGKDLPHSLLAHDIFTKANTLLAKLVEKEKIAVNSLHHQGVKTLGDGLIASALAPDGLVEAVELPQHPFALGVEWHPEELDDEASRSIFNSFVRVASGK